MKAVRINASRGLDGLDLIDLPDPGAPGPGEIRVRVHASSLNYHDYGVARSGDPKFQGRIPLSDGAGVVEAVGESVTEFTVGDSVVSCFFPLWLDGPATTGDFSTVPATVLTATPAKSWCVRRLGLRAPRGASATHKPRP